LWTSLLDPRSAPATALRELCARRWEHEWYYRELKHPLRQSEVLQSHTLETGAQEIAAGVLASAVRQPVSGWPRLRRNQSWNGPVHFKIL
jgi:hypothetical protein